MASSNASAIQHQRISRGAHSLVHIARQVLDGVPLQGRMGTPRISAVTVTTVAGNMTNSAARRRPTRRTSTATSATTICRSDRQRSCDVHEPADRDAVGALAIDDTERTAGIGIIQPRMAEQGTNRRQGDRFPPYRPREAERAAGIPFAAEHSQPDLPGAAFGNHRQCGQPHRREAVRAMLGGLLRLQVRGVGGAQA